MQSDPQDEQTLSSGGGDDVVQEPSGTPDAPPPANQEPRYPVPPPPSGPPRGQPPAFTPPPPPDDESVAAAHAWGSDAASHIPAATPDEAIESQADVAETPLEAAAPPAEDELGSDPYTMAEPSGESDVASAMASSAPQPNLRPAAAAALVEPDHMAGICPYLQSEDGDYRSIQPDEGHRCAAQEPLGTLPLAFQERFCLTDRHDRCEMYKYAQEASGGTGAGAAALAASTSKAAPGRGGGGSKRPAVIVAAGFGAIIALVVLMLLLFGGGDDSQPEQPTGSEASAEPATTGPPTSTPEPTPQPTPEPDPDQTPDPDATPPVEVPAGTATIPIRYQVQEGEQLIAIADVFGVSRRRILRANPGMEDLSPYVQPGDEIIVPASSSLTIEELEAVPGYLGLVEP